MNETVMGDRSRSRMGERGTDAQCLIIPSIQQDQNAPEVSSVTMP